MAIITPPGEEETLAGTGTEPSATQEDAEKYTLTVIVKTGEGGNDQSDGSDRVRMYVFLGDDQTNKKELSCGGFGRGSEIAFEGMEFDYPLEKLNRISLLCLGGTDAWVMESVSFQLFREHMSSRQYTFSERTPFSGEGSDKATTLKSFKLPEKVAINKVALKPIRPKK